MTFRAIKEWFFRWFPYIYRYKSDAWKDHFAVDAVVPFLAAFIERFKSCSDNPVLTAIHAFYPIIYSILLFETYSINAHSELGFSAQEKIDVYKRDLKHLLEGLEDVYLFSQAFYMFDHFVEGVARNRDFNLVEASTLEQINFVAK